MCLLAKPLWLAVPRQPGGLKIPNPYCAHVGILGALPGRHPPARRSRGEIALDIRRVGRYPGKGAMCRALSGGKEEQAMSSDRIFLLVFGIVLAATRSLGIMAPGFFGRFAAAVWRSPAMRAWAKPWAVVAMAIGGLGLYLAWGPLTVQGVVLAVLSWFLLGAGFLLFIGWVYRFADKVIEAVQDPFLCRVMCSMAVVIGLLLIAVALA